MNFFKTSTTYLLGLVLAQLSCCEGATFIPLLNWSWSPQILYPHLFVSRPLPYVLPYYNNFRPHVHQRTDPQARGLLLTPGVEARHSVHRDHGGYGGHSHDDSDTNTAIQTILHSLGKTGNDSVFTCPDTGVNATYPHPWDCSKYYLCEENQQPKEYDCLYDLTGLLFDSVSGTCIWAAKAKCFSINGSDNGIEAVEAEYDPNFDCEEPGLFTDPEYCMRYFRCDRNLEVHLEYCTTGTFYDTNFQKCLWASDVTCGDRRQEDRGFEDDIFRRFPFF